MEYGLIIFNKMEYGLIMFVKMTGLLESGRNMSHCISWLRYIISCFPALHALSYTICTCIYTATLLSNPGDGYKISKENHSGNHWMYVIRIHILKINSNICAKLGFTKFGLTTLSKVRTKMFQLATIIWSDIHHTRLS